MQDLTHLAEQARRVELLLDAAPDSACPPDLDDFVAEVEKLISAAKAVVPKEKPTDPVEVFVLDDNYKEPKIDHVEINLREAKGG